MTRHATPAELYRYAERPAPRVPVQPADAGWPTPSRHCEACGTYDDDCLEGQGGYDGLCCQECTHQ